MLKTPPPVGSAVVSKDGMVSEPWRNFFQALYRELNGNPLSGFQIGTGGDVGDLMWRDQAGAIHKVVDV
jgi:hypothetical protein